MPEWIEIKYRAGKISIDGIVKGNKEEKDYKNRLAKVYSKEIGKNIDELAAYLGKPLKSDIRIEIEE